MLTGPDMLPVIDSALWAELEMVGGIELPPRLVTMFLDDVYGLITQINTAVEGGDASTVAKSAHRIKGGAAAVGARRVATVAKAVESAGRESQLAGMPDMIRTLETEIELLKQTALST